MNINMFWEREAGNQQVLMGPERMNWMYPRGEAWVREPIMGENDVLISFSSPFPSPHLIAEVVYFVVVENL